MIQIVAQGTLSAIADVAGIIGFGLTVWIGFKVHDLARYYGFRGRVGQFSRDVRRYSSELSTLLNSNDLDAEQAQVTLRRCESTLKSVRRFIPGNYRKPVKDAQKAVRKAIKQKDSLDRPSVRDSYDTLVSVESDLKNIQRDEDWRPPQ